jgi:hypothetical protein
MSSVAFAQAMSDPDFCNWPQCMVRPCIARRFRRLALAVLHQCIWPLLGAIVLRAIMDIARKRSD